MRLLLDTHVLLWWMTGEGLSDEVTEVLVDPAHEAFVSMATIWEIAIKQGLGRLHPPEDPAEAAEAVGFDLLSITPAHTRAVQVLPQRHRDPFDRMLVAQAQVERLTLLTRDRQLKDYDVRLMAA